MILSGLWGLNEFLYIALRLPKKKLIADWTAQSWVNFMATYTHAQSHTHTHTVSIIPVIIRLWL